MTDMRPDASQEDILRQLTEQAKALWGEERARALLDSLEQAAGELWEIDHNLPDREIEPGFYQ